MFRVLIVEDEDLIRTGLIYNVDWKRLDCIVVGSASDGLEGVSKIRKLKPDIVLADVTMPMMGGLEMIKQTDDIDYSAIVLSGYSDFDFAQQAIELGVVRYLSKPLHYDALEKAVQFAKEKQERRKVLRMRYNQLEELKDLDLTREAVGYGMADPIVQEMLDYVSHHYQTRIQMKDIAETMNYSEVFLNKKFKNHTGKTYIDFVNRYRIQQAVALLQDGPYRLEEIGALVGIPDPKYFAIVFRKYIGYSPKEYAQLLNNEKD